MSSPLSLDEQITAAERRLLARDVAVREELQRLGSALRSEAVTGVRRGAVGLVATLSVLALAGLVGRRSRRRETRAARSLRARDHERDDEPEPALARTAVALPAALVVAEAVQHALSSRPQARSSLPWSSLVATIWPLLPGVLTRRVSSRSARVLVGLATAVVLPWWSRRRGQLHGRADRGHEP